MIPQFDLKRQYELLKKEIDTELRKVLNSGKFILGENVQEIEERISNYLDVNYAVSCNSGTDAIFLALKSINVGNGDEVITTPFTFISTVEAIINIGAKPIFADIDEDSFNIDTRKIEEKISDKTRAIMPVHLFGNPVNIKEIKEIIQNKDIKIIEDCAQSFGAKFDGDNVGTVGDIGCFSFYPTKNLGCYGDGGLITTNSKDIYTKLISLRNHGSFGKYNHDCIGINSRLDEIQAAILKVKMNYINEYNNKRISNAELYSK
ncbi:MAG: DegT/DnrJ/EryC1/StrS family aminotransferase, partial [Pseudomonadota bacterium]|nr:DegT/DnrJ/EryC1/StrS family aminotransferase [Pseudomonadota bacterium]